MCWSSNSRLPASLASGLNGGPQFKHSEAFSFVIATDDQAETDRYWNAIVGNGGQESACGWCKDKWGVSWQITPRVLTEAMAAGGDEAKRAFEAMMTMKKIDVAANQGGAVAAKSRAGLRPRPGLIYEYKRPVRRQEHTMEQLPRLYLTRDEMMKRVARFKDLKGSDGGLPDSKMPGCERTLFNVIGFQPPPAGARA